MPRAVGKLLARFIAPALVVALVWVLLWRDAPAMQLNTGLDGYRTLTDQLLIGQRIIRTTDAVERLTGGAGSSRMPLVMIDQARILEPDLARFGAEKIRRFLRQSRVRSDIARNVPELWEIDNSLIGVREQSGKFLSPFAFTDWSGQLLFARAAPSGRWAARIGNGAWGPLSGLAEAGQGGWRAVPCRRGCDFEILQNRSGDQVGELRLTLTNARWDGGDPAFCASTARVPPDADTRGVCLELRPDQGPSLQLIHLTASSVISANSDAQAGYRLAALANSVRAAKSSWVQNGCDGKCGSGRDARIVTTLDRELTIFAQESLDAVYDDRDNRTGLARPLLRPAAVTLMDAQSGAILALAGRDRSVETSASSSTAGGDVNFQDMPIGSVAKPLIASAVFLQQARGGRIANWDALEINQAQAGNGIRRVLGIPLDSPLDAHRVAGGDWLGAAPFVTHSSNYYAAALMLLSCTSARGPPARWQGTASLRGAARATPCVGDASQTQFKLPWLRSFADMYGPVGTGKLSLWGSDDNGFMPNPANFWWLKTGDDNEVETVTKLVSFRGNVVPIILGGQDSTWNAILVAQSFARLVTGKQVSASLVRQTRDTPNLSRGNWGGLSRGLAEVATVGTAEELAGLVQDHVFYAKTGTPELDVVDAGAVRQNYLIRNRYNEVDALTPQGARAPSPSGWSSFEVESIRYKTFNGRIVSAASLNVENFFAKTFVFYICKRGISSSCLGRSIVGFVTMQDPTRPGINKAFDLTKKLLREDGILKEVLSEQIIR